MRFLHWNVHMWRRLDGKPKDREVSEVSGQFSPELVSLVEVDEPWGEPTTLSGLAEELGYRWIFVPAFEYRCEGGFGNALLSRLSILAVQQWQLLPPRLYDGSEPSEPRAAVVAKVEVGDTTLWAGSTHLPRHDAVQRADAAARLRRLLACLEGPFAVCGDFNQGPDLWHPDDPSRVPEDQPTYPAGAPTESIDYCLLRGVEGKGRVLPSEGSDHLPLLLELSIR